uniref:hypothetical protein n=1 Tax=Thaumasiovibrio occultus TaxID=1891184 RepID=UPI000B35D395|nr:hypothetical protein [Thaumasiovibrio occultus]
MEFNKSLLASIALPVLLSGCAVAQNTGNTDNTAASCFGDQLFQSGKTYRYSERLFEGDTALSEIGRTVQVKEQGVMTVLAVDFYRVGSRESITQSGEQVYRFDKAQNQFGFFSGNGPRTVTTYDQIEVVADFNAQLGESTVFPVSFRSVNKETGEVKTGSYSSTVTFKAITPLATALGEFETCVFVNESDNLSVTHWYRRGDGLLLKRESAAGQTRYTQDLVAIESI